MCGIAGYLGPEFEGLTAVADHLTRSLTHRGPDDEGRQIIEIKDRPDQSLLLVHRRLAVIDLSPLGHQPMCDPETNNWIIFNGEIYNFKVLQQEMRTAGAQFRSKSDTEVILKGYAEKGLKILNDLCGMFAFAIWDASKGELLLAVDHLGIKPLYYWTGPRNEFLFGSEIRSLLSTGLIPRTIDPIGLEGYLSYGAVQGPNTIIEGIRLLLPGTFLRISVDGRIDGPHEYWRLPYAFESETPRRQIDNIVMELRELLETVVNDHLVSDVPIGIFLSGGIDSSSILAFASSSSEALQTFSVTFAEQEFSEAPYSREMAKRYNSKHTEICLSEQDLLNILPHALDAVDQPTLDGMNVYVISHVVRDSEVTVVLSGQGGDEVFAGYPTFRQVASATGWRQRLKFIPPIAWYGLGMIWNAAQTRRRVLPDKLGQFFYGDGSAYSTYFLLRQLFPLSVRRALFPGSYDVSAEGLPLDLSEFLLREGARLDPINLVSFLETRMYLGNMLLRDGDVMSMAHGLEVRVPFLDRRIVERVAKLPGTVKSDQELPKPLLLRIMDDRLPAMIYQRPKQGFTFPWKHWLRQELRSLADTALGDSKTFRDLGMEPMEVQRLWKAFLEDRSEVSWSRIWALIVLREWAVRHAVSL